LQNSKNRTSFETFAKQVALAISSVLNQHLTLIEETSNTMEHNPNIEALK
jgi:hypothetical protein